MSSSRLLAVLSSDPKGPVVRHRWRAYEAALEAAGIVLEVVAWPKSAAGRTFALQRATSADGVVVSSRLLARRDGKRLRRRARRLLFDFDDALPFRDSARGATRSRTRQRRFAAAIASADRVLAGNAWLAGLAAEVGGEAHVVPTTVDVPEGPAAPEPETPPFVLGWIGASATIPYVEQSALVLSALVASGHALRVRVIADRAPVLPPGIRVELVPWQVDTWARHLSAIHAGIAPLPDDPWTRGKCGLKILQMLALGRPVVASGVGVQRELVRDGETGFVADDEQGFLTGLVRLLEDAELRRSLGAAAREDVRARYSVAAWAPRVVAEVEALLT